MELRRVIVVLCGTMLLIVLTAGAASPAPRVRIATHDGRTLDGVLQQVDVALQTSYGRLQLDWQSIRRITFSPSATPGHDVVEFADGHQARGELSAAALRLETPTGTVELPPETLREIRVQQPSTTGWTSLVFGLITLSAMEIVLGIDNLIFLAIVAGKLPESRQRAARRAGLIAALGMRILLLLSLSFLLGLTRPIFTIPSIPYFEDLEAREVSIRDLILFLGGLFLLYKSVREIHERLQIARADTETPERRGAPISFAAVLIQIAVLDIIFSLDSVITAVGMVEEVAVMVMAMIIAMLVMLIFSERISGFVSRHPTIKILALAFLILIGVLLVADALGQHLNKGYIYFAMAFAVSIELINMRIRKGDRACLPETASA